METITLQVDSEIAKAYREAEPEKQKKLSMFLNIMLKKAIDQKPILEIMEEASQQAIAHGMTPEILDSILNEED